MNRRVLAGAVLVILLAGVAAWHVMRPPFAAPGFAPFGGTPFAMVGPGWMGPGMVGCCGPGTMAYGPRPADLNLSAADVRTYLESWLAAGGNPRIRVGEVAERDADTIVADIVTSAENALVDRFVVNRHSGLFQREVP